MTLLPVGFSQNCHKRSKTTVQFHADALVCGDRALKVPAYVDLSRHVHHLQEEKRRLQKEYTRMICDLMHSRPISKQSFDNVVSEMRQIDASIDDILQQYSMMPPGKSYLEEKLNKFHGQLSALSKEAHDIKRIAGIHSNLLNDLKQSHTHADTQPSSYVVQEGEYVPTTTPQAATPLKKKTAKNQQQRQHTKDDQEVHSPPQTRLTPQDHKDINSKVEQLLKSIFNFKDTTECASKSRSAPYYKTKEEIIKSIEEHEGLKKLMPANYKSLTKDKLCEAIFQARHR